MKAENRLFYTENLRILLTILVIAYNVGQAYLGLAGGGMVVAGLRTVLRGSFFLAHRSFFTSVFFMISGYFMVGSYERSSGARAFLGGRLVRLSLPIIAYGAVMIPLKLLLGGRLGSWTEVLGIDNLWYMRHGFFSVALADVPRDVGFFIIGAVAYPRGGLKSLPAAGLGWLAVGALTAAARYLLSLLPRPAVPEGLGEAFLAGGLGVAAAFLLHGAPCRALTCRRAAVIFEPSHEQERADARTAGIFPRSRADSGGFLPSLRSNLSSRPGRRGQAPGVFPGNGHGLREDPVRAPFSPPGYPAAG